MITVTQRSKTSMKDLTKELHDKYGRTAANRAVKKALRPAAVMLQKEMKPQLPRRQKKYVRHKFARKRGMLRQSIKVRVGTRRNKIFYETVQDTRSPSVLVGFDGNRGGFVFNFIQGTKERFTKGKHKGRNWKNKSRGRMPRLFNLKTFTASRMARAQTLIIQNLKMYLGK